MTLEDIQSAQKAWGEAIEEAKWETLLSLYDDFASLKPTLSNEIIRDPDEIVEYFQGQKISKVSFVESSPVIINGVAMDCGVYHITAKDGQVAKTHFTFCYRKDESGELKILSQHSSLFV